MKRSAMLAAAAALVAGGGPISGQPLRKIINSGRKPVLFPEELIRAVKEAAMRGDKRAEAPMLHPKYVDGIAATMYQAPRSAPPACCKACGGAIFHGDPVVVFRAWGGTLCRIHAKACNGGE